MRWMVRILLPVVVTSCLLTGCWDRLELNDRAIILGWGMDKDEDGQYLASAMIFIPQLSTSSSGGGDSSALSKQFKVFTGKGKTIMEAANQIQPKLSRVIFAGNRRMIVLGEGLAKDGLSHILDEYSRNKDVRLRSDMIVVDKGTALDLLQMNYPLEDSPATGALKVHEKAGVLKDKAMIYFMQAINDPGKSPTLPTLSLSGKGQSDKEEMQMTGTAVFDSSLKMKYKLNMEESYYYFWLSQKIGEFNITVPVKEEGLVNFELHHIKSKINVKLVQGRPQFEVSLKGDALLVENETTLRVDQMGDMKQIREALNLKCRTEMESFLDHIQREKTDIVGFNGYVHRKYPYAWKNMAKDWGKDDFAHASFKVHTNLNIVYIGLTGTSVENEEEPD